MVVDSALRDALVVGFGWLLARGFFTRDSVVALSSSEVQIGAFAAAFCAPHFSAAAFSCMVIVYGVSSSRMSAWCNRVSCVWCNGVCVSCNRVSCVWCNRVSCIVESNVCRVCKVCNLFSPEGRPTMRTGWKCGADSPASRAHCGGATGKSVLCTKLCVKLRWSEVRLLLHTAQLHCRLQSHTLHCWH